MKEIRVKVPKDTSAITITAIVDNHDSIDFSEETSVKDLKRDILIGLFEIDDIIDDTVVMKYSDINNKIISKFIEDVISKCVWDLLPSNFLYDLYCEYKYRQFPYEKYIDKPKFIYMLETSLKGWERKKDAVCTSSRMNKDEPLITEYNLKGWMHPTYNGNDLEKLREFKRKEKYRGFVKHSGYRHQ